MNSPLPPSPFAAGTKITDPRFFVGRKEELQVMTARMTAVQPISINIVGSVGLANRLCFIISSRLMNSESLLPGAM